MRTRISPENPFRYNRAGFAWEQVPAGTDAHLDFGCHDGAFLNSLRSKDIGRLVGVDISRLAVERAQQRFPELEVLHISKNGLQPFADRTFNSVTILDVLEHVNDQMGLLSEIRRVLTDDGRLIVTLPGRHLFSFLDFGNLKFRFPKLHKMYYRGKLNEEEYNYRYRANPDGLIGDIEAEKAWHEHFSRKRIRRLLEEAGFTPTEFDGTAFFTRAIQCVNFLVRKWTPIQPLVKRLIWLDHRFFESMNLYCLAIKRT